MSSVKGLLGPRMLLLTLLATAAAFTLLAACAWAEVPSVDAYGGQALVLGKPRPPSSRSGQSGSSRDATGSRSAAGRESGESSGPSAGAQASREAAAGAFSTRSRASHDATRHPGGGSASGDRGGVSASTPTGVAATGAREAASLARETQPIGLSGSDLALLLAIALGLAVSGVLVRLFSHRPS